MTTEEKLNALAKDVALGFFMLEAYLLQQHGDGSPACNFFDLARDIEKRHVAPAEPGKRWYVVDNHGCTIGEGLTCTQEEASAWASAWDGSNPEDAPHRAILATDTDDALAQYAAMEAAPTEDRNWKFNVHPPDFIYTSQAPHERLIHDIIAKACDQHPNVPTGEGFTLKMPIGALAQRIARAIAEEATPAEAGKRWWMVDQRGVAVPFTNQAEAEKSAAFWNNATNKAAPHRAVLAVDAADARKQYAVMEAGTIACIPVRPNAAMPPDTVAMVGSDGTVASARVAPPADDADAGARLVEALRENLTVRPATVHLARELIRQRDEARMHAAETSERVCKEASGRYAAEQERDEYERQRNYWRVQAERLERSNRGLRAVIMRMKHRASEVCSDA